MISEDFVTNSALITEINIFKYITMENNYFKLWIYFIILPFLLLIKFNLQFTHTKFKHFYLLNYKFDSKQFFLRNEFCLCLIDHNKLHFLIKSSNFKTARLYTFISNLSNKAFSSQHSTLFWKCIFLSRKLQLINLNSTDLRSNVTRNSAFCLV